MKKKFDFSGYATKFNVVCTDGRTIRKDAFKHMNGVTVPLVWQHMHDSPENILGQAELEVRNDGVYAYGRFNSTPAGQDSKLLVQHGDIIALSIFANGLKQQGSNVMHGNIKEVSLVLSGANPGALIDNLSISHADGSVDVVESEALIYTDEEIKLNEYEETSKEIQHQEEDKMIKEKEELKHAEETVQDVFDTLTEKQKNVVYAMIGELLSDDDDEEEVEHSDGGENLMKTNVFEKQGNSNNDEVLSHADFLNIVKDARDNGKSLKQTILAHAGTYGIDDIDFLFPEAKTLTTTPDFIQRENGWVYTVMSETRKNPFSRIKSVHADITAEEARALGYIKGNLKKDEVFSLLKRTTSPTTIYKKQKLDRDDMVDITDFDVVAWIKAEMRMMLDEELARAILIGDGREVASEDKIKDPAGATDGAGIRSIVNENELYAVKVPVAKGADFIEAALRARAQYKGTGNPTLFTTTAHVNDMLLVKDTTGRRIYATQAELESALRVSKIVEVPVMEGLKSGADNVLAIMVNLRDYAVGADKGGQVSMFDDFDIDYNQYKYLMETRISGALVKPKSALIFTQAVVGG